MKLSDLKRLTPSDALIELLHIMPRGGSRVLPASLQSLDPTPPLPDFHDLAWSELPMSEEVTTLSGQPSAPAAEPTVEAEAWIDEEIHLELGRREREDADRRRADIASRRQESFKHGR